MRQSRDVAGWLPKTGLAGVLLASVAHGPAAAQGMGSFEQLGFRFGPFNVFTDVAITGVYDDNVFAVPDGGIEADGQTVGKVSDVLGIVRPEVRVETNTQRHRLYFLSNASIGRWGTYSSQDYNDWTVETGGRWDVTRTFSFDGFIGYDNLHESATDPDRRTLRQTTNYDRFRGGVGFSKDWQRTFLRHATRLTRVEYNPVLVGPVNVNANRDNTRLTNTLRLGYRPDRQYDVFVQLRQGQTNFDRDTPGARDRDQQSYEILFGTAVDFDQVVSGEVSAGVQHSTFDDPATSNQTGFAFSGGLDWTLTPRTSLGVAAAQSIEPTDAVASSGKTVTALGVSLSHALAPNFALAAQGDYVRESFISSSRLDETYTAGASANYSFNRYMALQASYSYSQRESDIQVREYTQNLIFFTLVGQI